MKQLIVLALVSAMVTSCRKEDAPIPYKPPVNTNPEMIYTDLQNRELKFQQAQLVDLNQDNQVDIGFSTWYIGDPVEKEDEVLFFAGSYVHSHLLVNNNNGSPAFNKGDLIPVNNFPGLEWFPVAQVEMVYKNTPENGAPYWEGSWKLVSHKYLAVQVMREGKRYNGWIEVSFDIAGEKLILHKAAMSTRPEKSVIAGQ